MKTENEYRNNLVRRGCAAAGVTTEKYLAYFVVKWFIAHPLIPRPTDALTALEVYLSHVERRT